MVGSFELNTSNGSYQCTHSEMDIGTLMTFTSMIIENVAFELNMTQEKLTEILIEGSKQAPTHFHVGLGDLD
ncbi:hypothetical protein [Enterococcus sp. AZ101]|uniref:hypothetical protein n=1 Tax=Enterococcus sp. AZ101 TaxID=2774742 RepID=UPI003D2A9325